ncbi:MAG: T9SS type A sorting domain-containing protein, partial [Flavobacteriaceae bacterium]|nr:T9SS type A sorting domain-containing protein [Flavobacteriaceae bacterium]
KDFNIEQWTVFVNDGLDPDATPSQRHVLAPLLSEIATANTAANMQLGLHRIGATTRTGSAWSNGFPDRSRQVIIAENFAQSTQLNAKELQINTGINLTITNNLLVVSDAIVNNGTLRMAGGSQLVQTHENTANITGTGQLYIDQTSQTASVYRYDYWSSPVVENGETTYRIGQVMKDGTTPTSSSSTLRNINFVGGYNGDNTTSPISIANYWLYSFTNGAWNATGNTGTLNPGEGYLLKGPGVAQNYTFSGVPNDGTIASEITENTSKLVGNPYPSALDATKFIQDNTAVLDGSLYFWEHTGEARTSTEIEGHNKGGYQGGYATRNITMGVAATAIIGTDGLGSATYRVPGRYIAVGQGFFVGATSTGTLTFRNSQRSYQITDGSNSIFFKGSKIQTTTLPILKIGLDYTNTKQVKLHRQIGISFKEGNTDGYESGYDSEIYDLNTQDDDIYWKFGTGKKYVIAGVGAVQQEVEVPITLQVKSENPLVLFLDAKENISPDVYVYDKVENTKTKLSETGIVLNLDKGTYTNRFYISFNSVALSVDAILENQVALYYNKNAKELQIKMKSNMDVKKISLWNLLGQEVKSWKGKDLKTSDQTLKLKTGLLPAAVYVVKLQTFTGVVSKKIMVYR